MSSFITDVIHLVEVMVTAFQQKKLGKSVTKRIRRGRAPASSSDFEIELAKLIEKHTPPNIEIRVDFPISYHLPSLVRKKTIYPDIALIRNNLLIGILEAKIDLGYLSSSWTQDRNRTLQDLIAAEEVKMEEKMLSVPRRLISGCIVLSAKNHPKHWPDFEKKMSNSVVLLSSRYLHPNDKKVDKPSYLSSIEGDKTHKEQWRKLERLIRSMADTK